MGGGGYATFFFFFLRFFRVAQVSFFLKRWGCVPCKPVYEQPLEPSKIAQITESGAMNFQKQRLKRHTGDSKLMDSVELRSTTVAFHNILMPKHLVGWLFPVVFTALCLE